MSAPIDLTEEQALFRDTVRAFARAEIAPGAAEADEASRFPAEVFRRMGESGLLGIPVPEELGGAGADLLSYILALEEISRACGSTALSLAAHTSLATLPILQFGTSAQRERYVPPLARGESLGAFALTESGSGSDAAALRTRAERKGDRFVLTGSKHYITNATVASTFVVAARTSDAPGARGVSAFIVERGYPGIQIGRKEDKLGCRGSDTAEVVFDGCEVPAENLLGGLGNGFGCFMQTLDGGRIGIGAMGVGLAQAALDQALAHSLRRKAFGKRLADHGAIQAKLADMGLSIHASRLLVYHAARLRQAGLPHRKEAAMAKLFSSEASYRVTRDAIQILGASGYSRELPVERCFRDAKLLEIGEGTSEIQRIVISRALADEFEANNAP